MLQVSHSTKFKYSFAHWTRNAAQRNSLTRQRGEKCFNRRLTFVWKFIALVKFRREKFSPCEWNLKIIYIKSRRRVVVVPGWDVRRSAERRKNAFTLSTRHNIRSFFFSKVSQFFAQLTLREIAFPFVCLWRVFVETERTAKIGLKSIEELWSFNSGSNPNNFESHLLLIKVFLAIFFLSVRKTFNPSLQVPKKNCITCVHRWI